MRGPTDNSVFEHRPPWLFSLVVFLVLGSATGLVWRGQVEQQRMLVERHTADVGFQASRRLELFASSRFELGGVLALSWAMEKHEADLTHTGEDFARFSVQLAGELPEVRAVAFLPTSGEPHLAVRESEEVVRQLERLHASPPPSLDPGEIVLSPPYQRSGDTYLLLSQALVIGAKRVGTVVAEVDATELVDRCFAENIRSEFNFTVEDGNTTLYSYSASSTPEDGDAPSAGHTFPIANRFWRFTAVPRAELTSESGWSANLGVPLLGLVLSLLLAFLTYSLQIRMKAYRAARDRAVSEVQERRKAEEAHRLSETRYRSVFDSVSDALLVLGPDGHIVDANAEAVDMHGLHRDRLIKTRISELVQPRYRARYELFLTELLTNGAARIESIRLDTRDSAMDLEVLGMSFIHQDEPAFLVIETDMTERLQALRHHAQLSHHILLAQEEERARLARDLHDELGQLLTALRFDLDWLQRSLEDPAAKPDFSSAFSLVDKCVDELRRMCGGLRPPSLDDLGLEPPVRQLVEAFEERTGLETALFLDLDEDPSPIPRDLALGSYRILQEALTNVARHAKASQVSISLSRDSTTLHLTVYDDGKGFELDRLSTLQGFGIAGMHERAKLLGGTLEIRSTPDTGTSLALVVALKEADSNHSEAVSSEGALE